MSVKVMGAVFDIKGLSPTLKFVLLAYADHASHDGSGIWPAVQSIATKTGYSKRTIQNATKELQELGYMKKVGHHESGTNLWQINTPDMGGAGDSPPGVQEIHAPHAGDSPKPLVNHQVNQKLNGGKPPKEKRKRDERLDHPAIIAYREEAHLHIPINLRDDVVEVVDDAERWQKVIHAWMGKGWNKQNIAGMLEVYNNGWEKKNSITSELERQGYVKR